MKRLIIFLVIGLFSTPALPQSEREAQSRKFSNMVDKESQKYYTTIDRQYRQRSITLNVAAQILEAELEEASYIVGPGDMFNLYIFSEFENIFDLIISPEGQLAIPSVGMIELINLDLKTAKEKILEAVKEHYLHAQASVHLFGLRKFRVYITGEVVVPGTYFVQGSDRLSDVVEVAGGLNDWANDTALEIRHLDGTTDIINLTRFYRNAEKEHNPFLRGGDMIFAKSIDLAMAHVFVESRFAHSPKTIDQKKTSFRKIYPLLDGETIDMFFGRISAYGDEVDMSGIIVVRDGKEYPLDLITQPQKNRDFMLQSKDFIIIPNVVSEVYVQGEVRIPGAFPYIINYTANDYVSKAGVMERSKGSEYIVVVRAKTHETLEGGDVVIEKGDTIIMPRKTRESIMDYMTIILPIASIALSTYSIIRTSK